MVLKIWLGIGLLILWKCLTLFYPILKIYFKELKLRIFLPFLMLLLFLLLLVQYADSLSHIPQLKEIQDALQDLKPFKAIGIDGFQPSFYQKCQNFVHNFVIKVVQKVFLFGSILEKWNLTMICLIPKVPNPLEIWSFRPISLCTSLYKFFSKLLVRRIKTHTPSLISFNQVTFVTNRRVTNNVVIAQEVITSFKRKKKGSFGWMMVKLDLEKANDKLDWHFLKATLKVFKFPTIWINIIWNCISSIKHSILINGRLTEQFSPCCGI